MLVTASNRMSRGPDGGYVELIMEKDVKSSGFGYDVISNLDHTICTLPQSLDFHNDLITWLEPMLLFHAHHHSLRRAGGDHIAWVERHVLADVADTLCDAENHIGSVGILAKFSIDPAGKS